MNGGKHTEHALEAMIEGHLVGHGGWAKGSPGAYDPARGLFPDDFCAFVQATQPEVWSELKAQHKDQLASTLLDWLEKALESRGALHVLRHGFKFYGKSIDCAYFKPAHNLNDEILRLYAANRLTVTRQVRFNRDTDESVDIVLSVNGLPVVTIELKNQLTGQDTGDAIAQYKRRDPKQPLFWFKRRALVNFAVDAERVAMTTRLAGNETFFLPFNRGSDPLHGGGAGNPEHPSGIRTAYLWEETLARDSFLDIVGGFLLLATNEYETGGKKLTKETLIFPRFHQLDVVRKLVVAARAEGPGHSYLVQHSAGSGKSNSIAWLAHRLASLHDAADSKVFDSVIVVTDRRVLDKQLQDTIYQFEHKYGVVERITDNSTQLADALAKGVPIIITTLQKFPFVAEKIGSLPKRKYAVIVDEAHSSQTGESARGMKEVLGASFEEALAAAAKEEGGEQPTYEEEIERVMASRGKQPNLSFFAFTATPKAKTLEAFGRLGPDGKPGPFHLYTMRQAIEEDFILDVLKNYTTYATYYRLVKAIEDDPQVNKKKETSKLARAMSLHPHNLARKTEVMVEHFRKHVRHKIGGRAKAMVATASRLHAVRYKQAFDKYLAENHIGDVKTLVAFSGTVIDEAGLKYTEPEMNNNISETELPRRFASDEYQVLLVAEKYQTGFDQPLLHTMYVDKRLTGVHAVQTLSRLNRTSPGKNECFVLDFVNKADDIKEAFQPFYEWTTVSETADPHQLYDLQARLEDKQVYLVSEVEALAKVYYAPARKGRDGKAAIAEMYRFLEPAKSRFQNLAEEEREAFRGALDSFVRLYAFLAQVMPFTDADLEKLYTFGRFLLRVLPDPHEGDDDPNLQGEAELAYYRLEKIREGAIALNVAEGGVVYGPTEVGTGASKGEKVKLSEIIDVLNERFGTEFSEADQLFFDQVKAQAKAEPEVVQKAQANAYDNFAVWLRGKMANVMAERIDQNAEIVGRYLDDAEFQNVLFEALAKRIYGELNAETTTSAPVGAAE